MVILHIGTFVVTMVGHGIQIQYVEFLCIISPYFLLFGHDSKLSPPFDVMLW
jgi:hypothetical protein